MLKDQAWLDYAGGLQIELMQSRDEGKDVGAFEKRVNEILEMDRDNPDREILASKLLDLMEKSPVLKGYQYIEPSDLDGIKDARPDDGKNINKADVKLADDLLLDKIYGAWLGRCAGCLLGQPVEGWRRDRILGLLKDTENYPVKYYISSDISETLREKYGVKDEGSVYGSRFINWINNVKHMPEDDDTNYTVIGLKILQTYGLNFTPDNVGESWLMNLPLLHTCTAERVAYKNLVNLVLPPESGSFRNPYREWIGAQIRGDIFGYVNPGNPELAAEMAFRDASISHVKNGIYGEMFIAAMLSAAAVTDDAEKIIDIGLSQIPEMSRLSEGIKKVIQWKRSGIGWEESLNRIHGIYDEKNSHDWCHTISNAMIVCIGLMYGEMDLEKSIGTAVSAGFDTDCNGATTGSIVGMALGAKALPQKWIKPLNDYIKSGVDGFGLVKISYLAEETLRVARGMRQVAWPGL